MASILLKNNAAIVMLAAAVNGYEAPYKEERFGILLGRKKKGNVFEVHTAVIYRGGTKKRTVVEFDIGRLYRRGTELARKKRMSWIGCFHTHLEIAGIASHGLSIEDKQSMMEMSGYIPSLEIEMTVNIHRSENPGRAPRCTSKTLFIHDDDNRYLIKGYAITSGGIRQVRVRAPGF